MNFRDIKTFLIAFFTFCFANFLYNNFTTTTIAKGISFKEITVKVVGDIELDLDCTGLVQKTLHQLIEGWVLKLPISAKGKEKL